VEGGVGGMGGAAVDTSGQESAWLHTVRILKTNEICRGFEVNVHTYHIYNNVHSIVLVNSPLEELNCSPSQGSPCPAFSTSSRKSKRILKPPNFSVSSLP